MENGRRIYSVKFDIEEMKKNVTRSKRGEREIEMDTLTMTGIKNFFDFCAYAEKQLRAAVKNQNAASYITFEIFNDWQDFENEKLISNGWYFDGLSGSNLIFMPKIDNDSEHNTILSLSHINLANFCETPELRY